MSGQSEDLGVGLLSPEGENQQEMSEPNPLGEGGGSEIMGALDPGLQFVEEGLLDVLGGLVHEELALDEAPYDVECEVGVSVVMLEELAKGEKKGFSF